MSEKRSAGHLGNAWIEVDAAVDPGFYLRFLDATRSRALEFARQNPAAAFSHLALEPGLSVLDCGCGTGDIIALIAGLIAPGEAVGGDLSATMIQEARRRAAAPMRTNLRFESMDVQSLPFPDESFDRVLATQLLVHVPDPYKAFQEMCRVTRRGGRLSIADMDWDSLALGSSDKELGRRFTHQFSDGIRNGLVVREYSGWFRMGGFDDIQILPQVITFAEWPVVKEWILDPSLPYLIAAGGFTGEEASRLIDDLADRAAAGRFFAASTFYTVTARRML